MRRRLVLLADASNVHTVKWAREFAARAWDVHVLSLLPAEIPGVEVHRLQPPPVGKIGYLALIGEARALVRRLRPDLVHAHYATSYGLLGALAHHRPFVISVWGSDVYDFPTKSPLHRALLAWNLRQADAVTSSSHAMAEAAAPLIPSRTIEVVPFGVDLAGFGPATPHEGSTIGCAKILEAHYGQEHLIRAVRLLRDRRPDRPVRLLLAGEGDQRDALAALIASLRLEEVVQLVGRLPHDQMPEFLRSLSIFAMPSLSESFGVAAVEAAACGLPVVASRVGGVGEVVLDGETGMLVPPADPEALAQALSRLLDDPALRVAMGERGRAHVARCFDWQRNADAMEAVYERLLAAAPSRPMVSSQEVS
ncbi:D-inositol 3-phosphate glycosyltransferase [compost metagenome]